MEQNFKCALGPSESILKKLPQQIESPPPKPPRRRYSDQISASSLGTCKKHDENLRLDLKPKASNNSVKSTYLSLPANLTSNTLTEHNPPILLPHSISFTDQLNCFKENILHTQPEICLEKFKNLETDSKQQTCPNINSFENKEKCRSLNQGIPMDNTISKYQYGNLTSYSVDKLIRNSFCSNVFFTNKCDCQNVNSSYVKGHRRHHSDPVIGYFNTSNQSNSLKFNSQTYIDNFSFSSKKFKKCGSRTTTSCCKKNYFILQEIQILKEINEKLWQHLCSVQSCLENIRRKTYEESADISVSGLLSSMYYAQKAKDNAMEERLRIALEERDAALLELENVISIFTKSFDTTDALECGGNELDEGLKELLQELGCSLSPSRVLKYQRKILAHICSLKKIKQDGLSQELKCAVVERDNALEKVAKLEEEIKALKLCFDLWNLDNKHWELTLFEVVHQLVHQRDSILSKVDNNLHVGSIICRTQACKLNSLEPHTVPQFEYLPRSSESNCSHQLVFNDCKQPNSFDRSEEINKLREEILFLNSELQGERTKKEQAEGKCLRLERLIHTLRKKLNGHNIGIPV